MDVTVTVPGEGTQTLEVEDETYGDVIEAVGFHPQEATALVDGKPVPDDRPVDQGDVTVLRLITGG